MSAHLIENRYYQLKGSPLYRQITNHWHNGNRFYWLNQGTYSRSISCWESLKRLELGRFASNKLLDVAFQLSFQRKSEDDNRDAIPHFRRDLGILTLILKGVADKN